MSAAEGFMIRLNSVRYGYITCKEFFLQYLDSIILRSVGKTGKFYSNERVRRSLKPDEKAYHIKDVRLPLLGKEDEYLLIRWIYGDTYWSYVHYDDKYDEKIFDECDLFLSEGLYGLVNDKVNVTVKPGDIVIDAGSWIGDFAAYASVKGAIVYAFEPSEKIFRILEKTAELNGNIIPVKKGLSDKSTYTNFFECTDASNSGANRLIVDEAVAMSFTQPAHTIETIRLDDFVRENNLPRVDFIKCDIEGFERNMLAGAQETLRKFAPKLALCTYHLPDDPKVMAELILKANPNYNIVQKRMKLFASVPK